MTRQQKRAKDLPPEEVVQLFAAADHEVERRGTYWLTQCPIHDDHRPSLKVDHGKEVPTVVTCYAGCDNSDIWYWIEQEFQGNDHTPPPDFQPTVTKTAKSAGPVLTVEQYAAYLHVPVKFLQNLGIQQSGLGVAFAFNSLAHKIRRLDSKGQRTFRWENGESHQFPLFPMPQKELPPEVWICEGETDGIVARHLGLEAFGTTSGAAATPKHLTVAHFSSLKRRGVKTVVLVPHVDDAGRKAVSLLTTSAQAAGLDVRVCDLEEEKADPFDDVTWQPKDLHEWILAQDTHAPLHLLRERCVTQVKFKHVEGGYSFIEHADEHIDWVIPELIAAGDVIGVVAPPKNLKTYFALSLLHSMAACEPFLRRGSLQPTKPQRVMMVEEEGHKVHFAKRMRRVARAYDDGWQVEPIIRWSSGFILEEVAVDALIAEINFHDIDVLMLDPWQRITAGADESSASETAAMWDEIFRIRKETGCTILIIHHMRKDAELTPDAIRGSSRFRGEVDASLLLRYDSDGGILYLVAEGRDIPHSAGDGAHPIRVIWEEEYQEVFALDGAEFEETVSITLKKGGAADVNKQKVLDALKLSGDWMTKKEIEMATGFSKDTVGRHLNHLVEEQAVRLDPDSAGPGRAARYQAT
jgi:hypothetical protein